jgi:hypothetical protein
MKINMAAADAPEEEDDRLSGDVHLFSFSITTSGICAVQLLEMHLTN